MIPTALCVRDVLGCIYTEPGGLYLHNGLAKIRTKAPSAFQTIDALQRWNGVSRAAAQRHRFIVPLHSHTVSFREASAFIVSSRLLHALYAPCGYQALSGRVACATELGAGAYSLYGAAVAVLVHTFLKERILDAHLLKYGYMGLMV